MTTTDIRLFTEVTAREAERAFRRQVDERNRNTDPHGAGHSRSPKAFTSPRGLWWESGERRSATGMLLEKEKQRG